MASDFDRLEAIFRMMTPSTFVGGYANVLTKEALGSNVVQQLLARIYEAPGGGVFSVNDLIKSINEVSLNGSAESQKEFNKVISILGPEAKLGSKWSFMAYDLKNRKSVDVTSTQALFRASVEESSLTSRPYSIITVNSPLISPQRRDAEKVELFLNSIPGIVMSRCVPYVELEFGFNRPGQGKAETQLQTTSLLKFLLGADQTEFADGSANKAMIDARRILNPTTNTEYTTAGMELFTSPQTLINMDTTMNGGQYVNVIDPTRPFASLLSVTIDTKPTVGVYSFKKANIQFKLHDRSRLSEIADLVRPQVYTNTTVWLTYGWRHPFEPENPYALFINNNMLKREAYGVQNASFAFDQHGQIDVTLELYTKGSSEIRTMKINQNLTEYTDQLRKVSDLASKVEDYRKNLGLESLRPGGAEIRGIMLLDAAGKGSLPDFATKGKKNELLDVINELDKNLKKNSPGEAATNLIKTLKELYADKTKSAFAELDRALKKATVTQFEELRKGQDPYLMFEEKDAQRIKDTGSTASHPMLSALKDKLNVTSDQREMRTNYASFAKVFSVFVGNSLMTIPGIDEIQTVFYQLNSKAGLAGGINIAEFPIDINEFHDAYKEEIELKASDSFTVEEFIQLIIRSQIDDVRSIAYGYRKNFENYDKKNKVAQGGGKYQASQDDLAALIGPFQKPQLEVFIETTFAVRDAQPLDLLTAYNSSSTANGESLNASNYTRVLRIHIYDKSLNPYESATKILSNGKDFVAVNDDWLKANFQNDQEFLKHIKLGDADATLADLISKRSEPGPDGSYEKSDVVNGAPGQLLTNIRVKEFVAKSIPSIVYGTNASTIVSANLQTKQDPLLTAAQLTGLNKNKANTMMPNGSGLGGLPLRVIPAALSMTTLGCPLINYSQFFFVDFNTGTSLDNVYGVTGLVQTIVPGKFESQITFGFYDAYGKFEAASNSLEELVALLKPADK
jgi:hypothetical protein